LELRERQSVNFIEAEKAYELSALIYADSFFYGLFDYGSKLVKSSDISSDELKTKGLLGTSKATVRKSKFGILNQLFTLIPKAEYDHHNIADFVKAACKIDDPSAYIYRSDYIPHYGLRVCYAIAKDKVSLINEVYESPSLLHYVTALIASTETGEDGLYVHVIDDKILIAAKVDDRLQNANCYTYDADETAVYYIGLNYQETKLSSNNSPILLSGDIKADSGFSTIMNKYFDQTKLVTPPISIDGSPLSNAHQIDPLYAISICG